MNNKSFYLWIKGQKVEVSEEVYRAYVRPIRNEQRKEKYDNRCLVPRTVKGKTIYVRCMKDCRECEKAHNAFNRRIVSLELITESGMDFEDSSLDVEESAIKNEEALKLRKALHYLKEKDRKLIQLIYFEGKTQMEAAAFLGCAQSYIPRRLKAIFELLKKNLKNF